MRHRFSRAGPASSRRRITLVSASILGVSLSMQLASGADNADVPGVDGHVRGFVVSNIYLPVYTDEPGACPRMSDDAITLFYKSLPREQQEKMPLPEKRREVGGLMASTLGFKMFPTHADTSAGIPKFSPDQLDKMRADHKVPAGKGVVSFLGSRFAYDSCTNPDDFPQLAGGNQPYVGKIAYGMNLDGKISDGDFTSPEGEKGIKNQLLRATGCYLSTRDFGDPKTASKTITSLGAPTLIEVKNITDMRDDDVEVDIYASANPLKLNSNGAPLSWSSMDVDPDPRWHIRVHGKIHDGVLTTDKADIRVRMREQIIDSYRELLGARVRMVFKPDGTVEGGIYGYHTIASLQDSYAQSTQIGADLAKYSCPALMSAVSRYADGYPDKETKQNTAISSALSFVAVPAFVIHDHTAQADSSKAVVR